MDQDSEAHEVSLALCPNVTGTTREVGEKKNKHQFFFIFFVFYNVCKKVAVYSR